MPIRVRSLSKGGSFDDRLQLINASVPQRLQIDVQLSEAARVQVDIGVQQRQVYAGILLDNPVLRALATQNVQDLENQLGQADLDLEEFDVHEDNQLLSEQHGHEKFEPPSAQGGPPGESEASSISQEHEKTIEIFGHEKGWHLVA